MSFIQRERIRISDALAENPPLSKWLRLMDAQQALAWASDPIGFQPPFDFIVGSWEDTKDYPTGSRLEPSSDSADKAADPAPSLPRI